MINSGPINSFSVNALAADISEIIAETINVIQSEITIVAVPAVEDIAVADILLSDAIIGITESMALSAGLTASADRSMAVAEDIVLSDVIRIALDGAISEDIGQSDTVAG